jgi:ribonuclease BN (tRNA processing enzyme)
MRLHFLGTGGGSNLTGTRGFPCYVLEADGRLYVLDAGEGAMHAARRAGLDLLAIRAVFLTHPAIDHAGGLATLLWAIRKLGRKQRTSENPAETTVFAPETEAWEGIYGLLEAATRHRLGEGLFVQTIRYADGLVTDDGTIQVIAQHNTHFGTPHLPQKWASYGFRAELDGRTVVYTGDVNDPLEVKPLLEGGCDWLILDGGHMDLAGAGEAMTPEAGTVRNVALVHLPPERLARAESIGREIRDGLGAGSVTVPEDGTSVEL